MANAAMPGYGLAGDADLTPAGLAFNLPEQDLTKTLNQIARQSGTSLLFPFDQVTSLKSQSLKGRFTLQTALSTALENTGFQARHLGKDVVTIVATASLSDREETPMTSPLARQLGGISTAALVLTAAADAQQNTSASEAIDEIVITGIGSFGRPRSATQSPVAIDTVGIEDILSTGAEETGRILQELIPSFNFSSSSISDGTDSLRPATLRGLGPDQTLVLINGKRRHKSALIHVNTSVGRGTSGTDINAIPPGAIKRVEVLRDGASALYGSDAIAGVINFQLKDADEGGRIQTQAGQTYENDGTTFSANINKGLKIGDAGFLNLSYEFRDRENTNRAGLTGTCQFLCTTDEDGNVVTDPSTEALEIAFERQNFRIGDSDSEQHVFWGNLGLPITETANFYAFGSWGTRRNESAGFYRRANQGDRTLLDFFPNGFLPLIRPKVIDRSLAVGIEWEISDKLSLDTSANFGSNSFEYQIANTNNASLGLASPTVVDAGTLELSEVNFNIDGVYQADFFAVAFGGSFRSENYEIREGEPASFADGGFINVDTVFDPPLFDPTPGAAGAQVFRGFSPANAVDESRDSFAAYVEINADISDRINAQIAGRYEDYDGFGGTFTGKASALAQVVEGLNIRASVTTGFRAPSMQQLFFNSTSTQFVVQDGVTVVEERGTFRNDSALAQGLGIPELEEEESFSWGAGVVFEPIEGAVLTVDYYDIQIDDRIIISGAQGINAVPADAQAVFASVGATSGQFFLNGVDTSTNGLDVVGSYTLPDPVAGGVLKLTASANFTDTDVTDILPAPGLLEGLTLVTRQDISILESWQPQNRINLGTNWSTETWSINLQGLRYGSYEVCEGACDGQASNTQEFGAEWLVDAQVDYRFEGGLTISVGANNIFDNTPDLNLIGQSRGGRILDTAGNVIVDSPGVFQFSRRSAPFGFNGGYYYARVSFDF